MEREAKEEEEREAFERQRAIANFHLQQAAHSQNNNKEQQCAAMMRAGTSTNE